MSFFKSGKEIIKNKDQIKKIIQTIKNPPQGGMVNKSKSKKARGQGITKKKTKFKGIF